MKSSFTTLIFQKLFFLNNWRPHVILFFSCVDMQGYYLLNGTKSKHGIWSWHTKPFSDNSNHQCHGTSFLPCLDRLCELGIAFSIQAGWKGTGNRWQIPEIWLMQMENCCLKKNWSRDWLLRGEIALPVFQATVRRYEKQEAPSGHRLSVTTERLQDAQNLWFCFPELDPHRDVPLQDWRYRTCP